jgi:5-methylcytosine-specific restriction endonuclease McrBC GTP-binding regulatory subunit McrB
MTADQARAVTPLPAGLTVVDYCRSQGFPFEPDVIARYIAAFLTKPFVILAGVSGTGKSKLAELVAEFYTAGAGPGGSSGGSLPVQGDAFVFVSGKGAPDATRFALVAVRPDWIDNQSILGFVNPITDRYESTQALDLILRARATLERSAVKAEAPRSFMLLDEMNLARVEHYFSDWLSCTESRRYDADGAVIQQPVPLHRANRAMETTLGKPDGSTETVQVPASLPLPTNLVVTGTVNVDETTYGFSPKVLDRAMVLEFDEVDLGAFAQRRR